PPEASLDATPGPAHVRDRPRLCREAVPPEEAAVVVAGEEACLLALATAGDGEAGPPRLGARRLLVLLAEGEPDAVELRRVELRKHVGLVLAGVRGARQQQAAAMSGDACIVPGRKPVAPRPLHEVEE